MTALVRYDAACRALAEATRIDEVKDLRDKHLAIAAYARQAKDKELEANAQRIRWRAERRLGELQADAPKNNGTLLRGRELYPRDPTPTLKELGIDKRLADRARKLAVVPEDEFEKLLESRPDRIGHHLKRKARENKHKAIAEQAKLVIYEKRVFSLIYADPPWTFVNYGETGKDQTSPDNHYETMTYEQIAAFKYGERGVAEIAADDACCSCGARPRT